MKCKKGGQLWGEAMEGCWVFLSWSLHLLSRLIVCDFVRLTWPEGWGPVPLLAEGAAGLSAKAGFQAESFPIFRKWRFSTPELRVGGMIFPGAMGAGTLAYLGAGAREQEGWREGAVPAAKPSPCGFSPSVPRCSHDAKVFPDEWIMSKCLPFGY